MACYINIEDRYRCAAIRERQIHHVWAATAAAVVSVGATAVSAGMQASAASKAAKAQGAAGKKLMKQQKAAQARLVEQLGQIQAPQWDVARDIKDAGQITDYNIQQLEEIFPGARTQREIASRATESLLRGEIPKDVQEQIMRSVAELGGAGFAPTTVTPTGVPTPSGFQAAQGLLSRQIAETSLGLQQIGMSNMWKNMAIGWSAVESPLQVGQARLGYEKAAADIQMAKAQAEAGMAVDVAQGAYGTAVDTIGSRLAATNAMATGIQDIGSAIGGVGAAYSTARGLQTRARGAWESSFQPLGEMASKEQYAQGMRGYGLAGSFQNIMQGQLGRPARASIAPSAIRATTGAYG